MDILGWLLIIILFAVGMAGAVYPLLPGALAIYSAFFIYGLVYSFKPLGFWFWLMETTIVIAIFIADYAASVLGVKKFGGSRSSVIGSTIGVIIGPFVIPAFGLLIGPFLGAMIGELIHGTDVRRAAKVGIGAVVGLFSSMAVKVILQLGMIFIFVLWLLY